MRISRLLSLLVIAPILSLTACALLVPFGQAPGSSQSAEEQTVREQPDKEQPLEEPGEVPERFLIVPDDYHAEYAGVAEDGRLFFIANPFVSGADGNEFVATFFWNPDGSFESMVVDEFGSRDTLDEAAWDAAMQKHIADLGDYRLEIISVAPFTSEAFGVEMGFIPQHYDGYTWISLLPGDYMAYTPPWDGLYDT